jgi:hypothetical protein
MSKKYDLKQKIRACVPNIHYFLEDISAKEVLISDYEGTSYILKDIDKGIKTCIIEVINIKQQGGTFTCSINYVSKPFTNKVFSIRRSSSLCFIPIDGLKGLFKGRTSHCDFIFFNEKDFCFVELKLNATSLREETIRDNREKAISQLKNTISYFDKLLAKNYCKLNLEAFVGTPDTYPREDATFRSIRVKFLEETRIELYESSVKQYP